MAHSVTDLVAGCAFLLQKTAAEKILAISAA